MRHNKRITILICILVILSFACSRPELPFLDDEENGETAKPTATPKPTATFILEAPVEVGEANPDEPVIVTGTIPFTSPFFLAGNAEPFVLLEDQAGFVARNREFEFPQAGQAIGPVELIDEQTLSFTLPLPSIPQGTLLDVDNNDDEDKGVMVFAVAYWSNTWGGPFLEGRDGRGWSTAYASTTTDPEEDNEINGGHVIIWAPDDEQSFPSGFGEDYKILTEDDPVQSVPAGYSIVDLNEEPFKVHKEANPEFELIEGESGVNDFTDMSYGEAFDAMFEKVSVEYPFTVDKDIDWEALHGEYASRAAEADNDNEFFKVLKDFTLEIPDSHVGVSFNPDIFYEENGGSFGILLAELEDGRVIVTGVFPETTGEAEGIQEGAEITEWDGVPVTEALDAVNPAFGPYSTEHSRRLDQLIFLTRYPPGTEVDIEYQNPGKSARTVTLAAEVEYESLFASISYLTLDEMVLPLEGQVFDDSGLGYININTFSEDYNLMARIWERYIQALIDNDIPGVILDLRINGGGNMGLALDFVGYFFDEEIILNENLYYNENTGEFEANEYPSRIEPGPLYYGGEVAVLVSPTCVSACEGFSNAMTEQERAIVVGHFPTNGAFGEVGRGQYEMPGDFSMQFPTGRPETLDGELLIEGVGVLPDITVPITEESALGKEDAVLDAAVEALLEKIE